MILQLSLKACRTRRDVSYASARARSSPGQVQRILQMPCRNVYEVPKTLSRRRKVVTSLLPTDANSPDSPTISTHAQSKIEQQRTPASIQTIRIMEFPDSPSQPERYTYAPLNSSRHTRLIVLEPAADRNAMLHCTMQEVSLDDLKDANGEEVLFVALSYVWGAKTGTLPILCEGRTLLSTPNCHLALRYLRQSNFRFRLWVDALVIDQNNTFERSQQVALMPDIYERARVVWIWLGEGTESSRTFFRLSREASDKPEDLRLPDNIAKAFFGGEAYQTVSADESREMPGLAEAIRFLQIHESWRITTGGDMLNDVETTDVKCILEAEWYSRIWTLQELTLARAVTVQLGDEVMAWHTFIEMLDNLIGNYLRVQDTGWISLQARRWHARHMALGLFGNVRGAHATPGRITAAQLVTLLATCVFVSRLQECSDPRDKVYAQYGILSSVIDGLPAIDYIKNVEQVYEDFTRSTIISTRRFWPAAMYHWRVEASSAYPSWVPDMNYTSDVNVNGDIHEDEVSKWTEQSTSPRPVQDIVMDPLWVQSPGTIAIRGIRYATVIAKQDYRWNIRFETCHNTVMILLFWFRFCIEHIPEDSQEPFWELEEIFRLGRPLHKRLSFGPTFAWITGWFMECVPVLKEKIPKDQIGTIWGEMFMENEGWKGFLVDSQRLQSSLLFASSMGTFGVTTANVEQGDVIALLTGSNWPVILRPLGGKWRCIGSSHVPAAMKNHSWPPHKGLDNLETFTLI